MKKMPNIELSDKELALLIKDNLFNYGGEAVVCKNNNPHTLYKIFTFPGTNIEVTMPDNKLKKITRLYQRRIEGTTRPLSTLTNKGNLIGYEMTYDEDDKTMLDSILTEDEKIHYLAHSAELLQYFAMRDIIFGDVKNDNVLINKKTKKAKFCDIDNAQVDDLPIDVIGHGLTEYYDATEIIDEKSDAFMHNLLFLEQLKYNDKSHSAILRYLSTNPMLSEFPNEVREIITSLKDPQIFAGEYAIQYMKKR